MVSLIERFEKEWMTTQQAMVALRCSKSTLIRRMRDGTLDKRKVFGRIVIARKSVEKYLRVCLTAN